MEAVKRRVMGLFGNRENVTSAFLAGVLVVLGVRSSAQQREIEALEAEKSTLRTQNKAMSSAMWEWRQHLFSLADSSSSDDPSLSAATLRRIYGEDDPPTHLPLPEGLPDEEEDSIPIA